MRSKVLNHKLCICIILMVLLLAGCSPDNFDTSNLSSVSDNNTASSPSDKTVTDVSLVSGIDGDNEYAVITGTDSSGDTIWTVKTDGFPAAQMAAFTEIGIYEDQYFYVERGSVVSLDVQTGRVNWKNPDFGGSPSEYCHLIDNSNGNIYLSGYLGPDFYAVDKNGTTIKRIETIDSRYYWPKNLVIKGDDVTIRMEGSLDGEHEVEVRFKQSDY